MNDKLKDRFNQILPLITSDELLSGRGLGNEIAFYIFDYPPEHELNVREHIRFLLEQAPKKRPGMKISHINLFELIIDHLRERNLLDRSIKIQVEQGDEELLKRLKGPLNQERLAKDFVNAAKPEEHDMVIVSGIGSAYPLTRAHQLLNSLQSPMGDTPLLVFYPGAYDKQSLKLFGRIESNNYYRAFQLVP